MCNGCMGGCETGWWVVNGKVADGTDRGVNGTKVSQLMCGWLGGHMGLKGNRVDGGMDGWRMICVVGEK